MFRNISPLTDGTATPIDAASTRFEGPTVICILNEPCKFSAAVIRISAASIEERRCC